MREIEKLRGKHNIWKKEMIVGDKEIEEHSAHHTVIGYDGETIIHALHIYELKGIWK